METAITPPKFSKASLCLYSFFLETQVKEYDRREESDAESLVRKDHSSFQDDILKTLDSSTVINGSYNREEESFLKTMNALEQGEENIIRGFLSRDALKALPTLLQKVNVPSKLGKFSYIPIEIKQKSTLHLGDKLQLFFYAYLLEKVLGERPKKGKVILSSGEETVLLDAKLENKFLDLLKNTLQIVLGDLEPEPVRCSACNRCHWLPHCSNLWEQQQHISLLSGLSAKMAKKLIDADVSSCSKLSQLSSEKVQELTGASLSQSTRFVLGAESRHKQTPIILKAPVFEKSYPIYYYDIETYNDIVFCHGIIKVDEKGVTEKTFFCENLHEEESKWHELLDYLAEEGVGLVYCWTFYERTFVQSLWQKYGGSKVGFESLSQNLKDQCAFVRDHFMLPCRGYSIKAVAPYFNFSWQSKNANGMNCVAWYRMWLEEKSLDVKEKMIQYNLDDVRAMLHIDRSLQELVSQNL